MGLYQNDNVCRKRWGINQRFLNTILCYNLGAMKRINISVEIQMYKLRLKPLLLLVLMLGCSPAPYSPSLQEMDEAVYESLFLYLYKGNYEPLYIANATESQWFKKYPISQVNEDELTKLPGIYPKLLQQLYEINSDPGPLNWMSDLINVRFMKGYYANIENEHLDKTCYVDRRDTTIEKFTIKSYLRAYYTVSKVAYSKDKKIALLKYTYHCSPKSGAGDWLVTLQIEDNNWQVIDSINHWIHQDSPFAAG